MADLLNTRIGHFAKEFVREQAMGEWSETSILKDAALMAEGVRDLIADVAADLRRRSKSALEPAFDAAILTDEDVRRQGKSAAYDHAAEMLLGLVT